MVERLKDAIEKARRNRAERGEAPARSPSTATARMETGLLASLKELQIDPKHLQERRIGAVARSQPEFAPIDVLRTRLLRSFKERNWKRVAITSPTKGCGKSTISANLAFSVAHRSEQKVLLADLDLRAPNLASLLSSHPISGSIETFLAGDAAPADHLWRVGGNLALALNDQAVRGSAEVLTDPRSAATLDHVMEALEIDLAIFDMTPMLVSDDVIAAAPLFDAVLLIAAAGESTTEDIERCERLISDSSNFLGVVLNKSRYDDVIGYGDSYAY